MRSFLLRKYRYVELIPEGAQALRALIILRDIQREKSKKLVRILFLQENLPMKVKKMRILKIKRMTYLFLMLKLKIIMKKTMMKCLNHTKNHLKMMLIKNLSL
jgi:hypothetical protein